MLRLTQCLTLAALGLLALSPAVFAEPLKGVVKAINTTTGTVTLEDGTELVVSSQETLAKIHEGDKVDVVYEEKDGSKVVSSVEVTGQ